MKTLTTVFLTIVSTLAFSQEVLTSAGGVFQNSTVNLCWTLGEPVIETFTKNDVILTQGFHQTRLVATSIFTFSVSDAIKISPNPTSGLLLVEVDSPGLAKFAVLFDVSGNPLLRKNLDKDRTEIDFRDYPSGNYLLKIEESRVTLKIFKVIKGY